MNNQMIPTDFIFNYRTTEYNAIDNFLSTHNFSTVDIHLFVALFGSNNGNNIPLDTNDSSDARSFSRTVYNRNSPEMERNFGLLTILNSPEMPYHELLNNKAFLKNSNGEKFLSLPNVSQFYQSLLGGIEPLNELIFQYGYPEDNIFDGLYEYLIDDENIKIIEGVSDEVKRELL